MDKLSRLLGVPGDGHARHQSGVKPIVWAAAGLLALLCASAIGWSMLHQGSQPAAASASASASAPIVAAQSAPLATPSAAATPISTPEPNPQATPVSSPTAAPTAEPSPSPAPQAATKSAAAPATPEGKNYVDDLGGGVKLVMNWIPAGKFTMGSPANEPDRAETEGPQIEVTLAGFWMGKFEVTQAQYEAIAGSNPAYFKASPDNPVEMTGWTDAMDFCKKLSEKTGKTYTLPSESQWEYACRAGTKTRWSFGDEANDAPKYAWLLSNSGDKGTHAVGGGAPNAFGLYDMHGNVFEWCLDWYHPSLAGAPTDGSAWNVEDPNNPYRVLRSGSWHFDSALARSAYRSGNVPESRFYTLGFRVARTQ